ncbi:hypothetical protein SS50377_23079 [Spironucleus salmonicida]|uniref:Uncharacterized protein n=1 Tax=Spironucleus salmonicida TaxID=348837 RepID=V6LVC5_9EUKA|nr:hypothetical protein SS50377_23079 [Spironucleus salmonicida]|eukprot:EST47656.1 Hypothetical protein SS50377_12351 [Spironucleus salmonicida]
MIFYLLLLILIPILLQFANHIKVKSIKWKTKQKREDLEILQLPELYHENIYSLLRTLDKPTKFLHKLMYSAEKDEQYPWRHIKTSHFLVYDYKVFREIRANQKCQKEIIEISMLQLNEILQSLEKQLEKSWSGEISPYWSVFLQYDKIYAIK